MARRKCRRGRRARCFDFANGRVFNKEEPVYTQVKLLTAELKREWKSFFEPVHQQRGGGVVVASSRFFTFVLFFFLLFFASIFFFFQAHFIFPSIYVEFGRCFRLRRRGVFFFFPSFSPFFGLPTKKTYLFV